MGSDCCGGGAPAPPLPEQLAEENAKQSVPPSAPAQPRKSDAEMVAEKQPYYSKRIELFEHFRQRDMDNLQAAKAANRPLKGAPWPLREHACVLEG